MLLLGAFSWGGAERVMCSLANHLSKDNNVILVLLTQKNRTYELNSDIKCINGINWNNELHGIFQLRKIIKQNNPDLIISFITHVNIAAILASLFLKIPIIISERNDPSKSATTFLRKILRKITYPMASGFVFQTDDAKKYFSKKIAGRSVVIPNPLFLSDSPEELDNRINEVVSIGRLVPQKRHDLIIKSFFEANGVDGNYHLTIYGNGDEYDKLLKLIESLKMLDKIDIHNAVNDLHRRIRKAKIFVLMSEYEGMPNSLAEAMGLGLACISSDCPCGGPRYLIENGKNGYLIKVNHVDDLTNKLKTLMKDDNLIKKLSKNAMIIKEKLSNDRIFALWDKYIAYISNNTK